MFPWVTDYQKSYWVLYVGWKISIFKLIQQTELITSLSLPILNFSAPSLTRESGWVVNICFPVYLPNWQATEGQDQYLEHRRPNKELNEKTWGSDARERELTVYLGFTMYESLVWS